MLRERVYQSFNRGLDGLNEAMEGLYIKLGPTRTGIVTAIAIGAAVGSAIEDNKWKSTAYTAAAIFNYGIGRRREGEMVQAGEEKGYWRAREELLTLRDDEVKRVVTVTPKGTEYMVQLKRLGRK